MALDIWSLEEHGFDAENIVTNGNRFLLANGYMGYRGTMDEWGSSQLAAVNLAGVYDRQGDKWREPVNAPNKELIEMTLQNSGWSTVTDAFGRIDNILIDGLTVLNTPDGKVPESHFAGQGSENQITNVVLQNITILGQSIQNLKALRANVNEFCDITVK